MPTKKKKKDRKRNKPELDLELDDDNHTQETQSITSDDDSAEMLNLLASLYLNPQYSDLTIICGTEVFPVHRNIVCPRSSYFARSCGGNFKEALGTIELKDQDPNLIRKVLQFLYTGDYTFEIDGDEEKEDNLGQPSSQDHSRGFNACQFHVRMYAQADYFQIDGLKSRAERYFRGSFLDQPSKDPFEAIITEIYTSIPESDEQIRDAAIELTMDNLETLRNGTEVILLDGFLKRSPAFAADLCIAMLKRRSESQKEEIFRPAASKPLFTLYGGH
ncbi:BTB/POZ domain protein [Talaromyces stipitatus ATCC 10500]|uniref:BTB/POZ domain protein n=1 Tax=Talaromyces stipitatus (strain ATCC 10500 / CBS 375.48 / QM 6759 / NRRL 1006) TaxID=441959 RepID=B8MUA7_TALSN|nr:BTB/POZ domain protein [Talaromyces stipitatus ATCC 10500]EED11610.1 BTB/POZ domain protein [Talaromyces stipitatus ATCC 10500]